MWRRCFTVTIGDRQLNITITAETNTEVKLFTGEEFKSANDWQGPSYDSKEILSANELRGNLTIQSITSSSLESGIIGLRRIHNVYISSSNLSTLKTLGSRGESGIIKK